MTTPHLPAYIDHMRARSFATATTIVDRTELLRRVDTDLPCGLDQATTAQIEAWLARPGWSPATRNSYYSHLRAYFVWAVKAGHSCADPTAEMARPRKPQAVPDPFTDDQVRHAFAASNARWRRIIGLAAYAGLRASEICALRRDDVTPQRLRVVNGKGGKDAYIPTSPQVWALVEPVTTDLVVPSRYGTQLSPHSMSGLARLHFRRIGLPAGAHIHQFRHWYASRMLEAGVDLATVSKLMRHASVQTTMGYLAITDARRDAAVRLLPSFAAAA